MSSNMHVPSRRIDGILDKMEKRSGLTADGRNWLVAACDPFHDSDMTLAGYPDVNTSATVVQLVKKQLQIAVPAGITGNWDASVVLFPSMQVKQYGQQNTVSTTGLISASTATNAFNMGGLVVNAGASGANLWPNLANQQVPSTNFSSTAIDCNEFAKGDLRIIGMAFEVINTTATIQKQGQVTAWRIPSRSTLTALTNAAGTTPNVGILTSGYINRFPPGTIADAQLLFGSRSWLAEEGAYVVSRQNSDENPLVRGDYLPDLYSITDPTTTAASFIYSITSPSAAAGSGHVIDIHAPYDLSGVHFTGLSLATTLTVNVRWLIERSPGPNEPDLVVLATPSAAYDPLALELYCHCLGSMPPGVMVSENPLGEWFTKALDGVAKFAPTIGDALGNIIPGASAIGNVLGKGASLGANLVRKQQAKKQAKAAVAKVPLQGSASTTVKKK